MKRNKNLNISPRKKKTGGSSNREKLKPLMMLRAKKNKIRSQ